jgi:two-component system, NtrC family, response regulator AtoC
MAAPTVSEPRRDEGEAEGPALYLLVVGPGFTSTQVLPPGGALLVGRDEAADVRIVDPMASRRHARLHVGGVIEVEDLDSANGTRVRDQKLVPGQRVAIAVGEAVTIGSTMLVLQRREPATRPRRLWPHGYFETRLIEECARAEAVRGTFALARLSVAPGAAEATPMSRERLAEIVAAELRPGDVIGEYGPDEYEVLLPDSDREASEAVAARIARALAREAVSARAGLAFFPADGTSPGALFSHACALVRGASERGAVPAGVVIADVTMRELYALAERVAPSPINVLIVGETGSGKELLAETLHRRSPRAAEPFLCINCAALTESLLESELFGHEKGAFTGAAGPKPGLLEVAGQGTVFLDEIGEMSASLQAKLLRAIETREVRRVGGTETRRIEARFVAATNRDLAEEVEQKAFRQDLYFRLAAMTLSIPPLRDRPDEIEPLARLFLETAARQIGRPPPALSPEVVALLRGYAWPGNIRELRNVMERTLIFCVGSVVGREHLPLEKMRAPDRRPGAGGGAAPANPQDYRDRQVELEKNAILEALARCGGNQTRAAELLNMPRRTFCNRLVEFGIRRPRS